MDRQIGPYFKIEIQGSMGSMDRQIRPYFNIAMQVSIGRQIGPYFKIWFIWIRSFEQLRTLNWSEIGQFWLKIGHFSVWVIESIWYRYDMRSAYIQPQGGEKCPFQIFTLRFGHIIFRTINFRADHFNLFWNRKSRLISNWKRKMYLHFYVFLFLCICILSRPPQDVDVLAVLDFRVPCFRPESLRLRLLLFISGHLSQVVAHQARLPWLKTRKTATNIRTGTSLDFGFYSFWVLLIPVRQRFVDPCIPI